MNGTIKFAVMAVCLSLVGPVLATGQDHADHHPAAAKPAAQANDAFATYDTNKDGKLSKDELAKHPRAAHASMVDANRDGAIDRKEFAVLQKM